MNDLHENEMDTHYEYDLKSHNLPKWCRREFPDSYLSMKLYEIAMDGNCLFKSLQVILASAGLQYSVEELRRVVADPVLNEQDQLTNNTIAMWLELVKGAYQENDQVLMNEYRHVAPLHQATWPLNTQQRQVLWHQMLKNSYWGEQHACRIFEEQTQMRILFIQGDNERPNLCWYHSKKFDPTHYVILYLNGQHYNPVSINDTFIFEWKDVPEDMKRFMFKAYPS